MACQCDIVLNNTGTPTCQYLMAVGRKLIMVPLIADDGTTNQIDLVGDTLNQAYFSGKVNEADASKRWYPLPLIDNVEDLRNDPILETLNSGANLFVQQGTRTFTGVMVNQSAVLLDKLEEGRCKDIGVYIIDKDNSLIGSISADGLYLNPIAVDQNTWYPRLVKTTDTTVQKIQLDFEFGSTEYDRSLRLITATEHGATLLTLNGLLDTNHVISAISTTGFTDTITLDFGTAKTPILVKGLVSGDFALYNNTTPGAVIITSVTESSDGVYDFIIPAQTPADNCTLTFTKTAYQVETVSFDIP